MSDLGTELERLASMGSLAREAAHAPADPDAHREGRDRIVGIAASRRYRGRTRSRVVMGLALAATLVAAGIWLRPRPLRYEVVGAPAGSTAAYVSAPPESPVDLRFSDGSDVRAEPGSRLRVDETYGNGARVLLDRGKTTSHVAHHKQSNWTFVAGPFEVHVIGTRFDLRWDPLSEEIDLRLREGSVEVRSPLADGPIVVRAGQRFRATMSRHRMTVTDAEALDADETVVDNRAPATEIEPPASPPPAAPVTTRPQRRESWQELLARGEFESVVSAAGARGFDGCVGGCSAADLRSLADAARYTGRSDLAERCLLGLRKRFSGSTQSAAAAFLLGRTHEPRDQATAARWYETYLAESPDGEFAAEALAGRMRSVAATSGVALARPLAAEYLRRYPQGVHLKTARKIAGLE